MLLSVLTWMTISYRDVTKSPIEDVDTTSYELSQELASEGTQEEGAWLCEVY